MNSKLLVIAKRDFIEAARSRLLWGAVLVLLVVTIPDYLGMINGDLVRSMQQAVRFMPMVFQYFIAPIAMITAYKAVVGERESGSLRILFGHPATRRDFVLGKLISRSTLLVVILSIATLGLGIVTMATYGSLDFSLFGAILGYIALYGVVWAGSQSGSRRQLRHDCRPLQEFSGYSCFLALSSSGTVWRSLSSRYCSLGALRCPGSIRYVHPHGRYGISTSCG